jgi:hypothetical protein
MSKYAIRIYSIKKAESNINKATGSGWRVHTIMPYFWNEVGDDEMLTHVAVTFEQTTPMAKEIAPGEAVGRK